MTRPFFFFFPFFSSLIWRVDPDVVTAVGLQVSTATFNGLLLGTRWGLEGLGAPLIGRLIDRLGWERVAPAVFGLSSLNGAIAFGLLHTAEVRAAGPGGGGGGGGLLMPLVMCSVFVSMPPPVFDEQSRDLSGLTSPSFKNR